MTTPKKNKDVVGAATHMMLPNAIMQKLLNEVTSSKTWIELDPLMTEVKANISTVNIDGETITLIKP